VGGNKYVFLAAFTYLLASGVVSALVSHAAMSNLSNFKVTLSKKEHYTLYRIYLNKKGYTLYQSYIF